MAADSEYAAIWLYPRIKVLLKTVPEELVQELLALGAPDSVTGIRLVSSNAYNQTERFRWYLFMVHGLALDDGKGSMCALKRLTPDRDPAHDKSQARARITASTWDGVDEQQAVAELKAFGVYMPALFRFATAGGVKTDAMRIAWNDNTGAPLVSGALCPPARLVGGVMCMRAAGGRCEVYGIDGKFDWQSKYGITDPEAVHRFLYDMFTRATGLEFSTRYPKASRPPPLQSGFTPFTHSPPASSLTLMELPSSPLR